MAFKIGASLFLVIMGINCFLSEQVSAKSMEECTQETAKVNIDLVQAVKNNRRDVFRKDCEIYRKLVEECLNEHVGFLPIKLGYQTNCLSDEAQKWLKSSGTTVQGGLLAGFLTTVIIMLRL